MVDGVALSALDWWAEAGVDTLADDLPRDWLAPVPAATQPVVPQAANVEPKPAEARLPETLDAFRAWLLGDAPIPGGAPARIDATGDASTGITVVVDMPEAEDRAAGSLLSGDVGTLFDRMLAAIQLDRKGIYLLPFSPARPTTGRLAQADIEKLRPFLLHHLALAAPRKLLLLGDAPVQALLRQPVTKARDAVHSVLIGETEIPAVASIHPRLVHARSDWRKPAWSDLQRFAAL